MIAHTSVSIKSSISLRHLVNKSAVAVERSLIKTNLIVDSGLSDHGNEDIVGFPDEFDILTVYLTENPDSNTRAWEWVTHNKVLVDA
ncbi:hypothetical protein RRF57_000095 [Xylaria bambusicola]|uniref:Uncharacterized protein n=1 Tax=Xylaria bambusicola TaxID=326684 RepID=A0AAN7UMZ8_9PEZI